MRFVSLFLAISPAILVADEPPKTKPAESKDGWKSLFDGKTLGAWKSTEFVNGGKVDVDDGAIRVGAGQPMTGIVYKGPKLPDDNYEIAWEAKRTDGRDFFCALTFPVKDAPCTFVVAGWGGNVTGLSSLNGADASENATTCSVKIENDKWYKMRVRTTPKRIECWVDEEKVIEIDPSEYSFSVRIEVDRCRPFGFASYRSTGRIRNIRLRPVGEPAAKQTPKQP
jgi:hypothetical protein